MGRASCLTPSERAIILRMKHRQLSISEISKNTGRSRKVISNFLKNPEGYRKKKIPGRPSVLTSRQKRIILRIASNSSLTARECAQKAGVQTNIKNVRRVINGAAHIKRRKMKRIPPLSNSHKERRKQFARDHIHWKEEWKKILFSDEKKFNLDGPDGWAYYYHDLRKEEKVFSKRQFGGGSVMVWGGIGYNKKTDIVFVSGKMKSRHYLELIDTQLKKYSEKHYHMKTLFSNRIMPLYIPRKS